MFSKVKYRALNTLFILIETSRIKRKLILCHFNMHLYKVLYLFRHSITVRN